MTPTTDALIAAASALRTVAQAHTTPSEAVPVVLNPLDYAWGPHVDYLTRYGKSSARTLWLGMNPGPWGMAQTGVPFGAVNRVRDFLKIGGVVQQPPHTHPKRPIEGFDCARVEVSGDRLWGTIEEVCGTPERFFEAHFVTNYCPLVWQSPTGANITPDKLPGDRPDALFEACDEHVAAVCRALGVDMILGVGAYAEGVAKRIVTAHGLGVRVARILHPSPASPAANRGWKAAAVAQLDKLGRSLPAQ